MVPYTKPSNQGQVSAVNPKVAALFLTANIKVQSFSKR